VNAEDRAEFRAFVREHHPDRGGDPDVFAAGLARFGASESTPAPDADPGSTDSVDLAAMPFPVRVGVALIRTWHRLRDERAEPPADPSGQQRGEP
jgi:hypothetical protein